MIQINRNFCGGAIEVIAADKIDDIKLNIPKDNQSCTRQWFYFAVETDQPETHGIKLVNAGKVTFDKAWQGYCVFVSYDNDTWFTLPTTFDGKSLVIEHNSVASVTYYAYFVPYSLERQLALEERLSQNKHFELSNIATTLNGNQVTMFSIGDMQAHKKNVWLIARQHPGESMAQWISEGIVNELSDIERHQGLFDNVNVFVVMNMNPDGSQIGNHRTNAQGKNLNRCWSEPSALECPEVFSVQREMKEKGVDFFIDIHGDETIPYNFIMNNSRDDVGALFKRKLADKDPRFQLKYDYATYQNSCSSACGVSSCGAGKTATAFISETFEATSLLLEASFKPLKNRPDTECWNHTSCTELGHNIARVLSNLFTGLDK
ncbi:MAG: carboxypeptidase family protein [Gammaproteobacteria bacterium]|nr:carboxypeptidase family protein [Gammaproteobacteria bacterium]